MIGINYIPVHGPDDFCLENILCGEDHVVEAKVAGKIVKHPVAVEPEIRVVRNPKLQAFILGPITQTLLLIQNLTQLLPTEPRHPPCLARPPFSILSA